MWERGAELLQSVAHSRGTGAPRDVVFGRDLVGPPKRDPDRQGHSRTRANVVTFHPVTEPVKSLGVSLAEDEKGRGAAELQVGDAR